MSVTFTKLASSITESTVWCAPDRTRLVWIAMLAMADKHGRVWASIPGLANRARVPLEDCEIAIDTFLAPDPYSRTPDNEGRRIKPIDGGWQLLNHAKYREMRDAEDRRAYQREWVKGKRNASTNVDSVDQSRPPSTYAEAEAEADTEAVLNTVGLVAEGNPARTARGTRLPNDWGPSDKDKAFCMEQRSDLDIASVAEQFRDYWHSQPGKAGVKLNWSATWRNWVRNQRSNGGSNANNGKFDPFKANADRLRTLERGVGAPATPAPDGDVWDDVREPVQER